MNELNWTEEREKIREEALERHERLHSLFVEDRLSFERERKKAIDELISRAGNEEMKQKMRAWQSAWDKKMRHAGSNENRFVLARSLFWEHFHEVWNPAIQEFLLNGKRDRDQS